MIWIWTKEAVKAFWGKASAGAGRLNVREGMDAALATDLPHLTPTMAAFWVAHLTMPGRPVRNCDITFAPDRVTVHEDGSVTCSLPLERTFLLSLLDLNPEADEDGEATGTPAPLPTDPAPPEASAEEPLPVSPPADAELRPSRMTPLGALTVH